jgi:hypothetical protein
MTRIEWQEFAAAVFESTEISLSQNDYAGIRHDVMDEIEMNVNKGAHRDVTSYDGGSSSRIQILKD